ncbi:MAG: hypothetical protein ACPGF7_09655 [Pontibacterium sp.]
MDTTAIFIIVISTLLAIVFKVVVFKKIRHWMDQDLIKGLASENQEKHSFLLEKLEHLKKEGIKRKEYHDRLTVFAKEFEQSR